MTGPENYREAERLVSLARDNGEKAAFELDVLLKAAQVHATLALAAACGLDRGDGTKPVRDRDAWHEVAGTKKPESEATP